MSEILNELVVMNDMAHALRGLSTDEIRRIIDWLADYFDVYEDGIRSEDSYIDIIEVDDTESTDTEEVVEEPAEEIVEAAEPETFEAFYELIGPKTAIQKIVTSAYWLETKGGQDSWTSFQANKLLKSLDVKISSVSGTLAIEGKKDRPLIKVLEKSGDSMQSRKVFRLSDAGLDFVEAILG